MTKDDVVTMAAERSHLPKSKIATAFDIFLASVAEALINHERVEIRRFGTFEVKYRRSRVARDLNTNQQIQIPGRAMPRFIPFDAFKQSVADANPILSEETTSDQKHKDTSVEPPHSPDAPTTMKPVEPPEDNQSQTIETMLQTLSGHPDDHETRLRLAVAYTGNHQYLEALDQCQDILHRSPAHLEAINHLGKIMELRGEHDRAVEAYQRALGIDRENTEALYNLGLFHYKKGQYTEAEQELRRVLELDPSHVEASYHLGIIHTKRGLYTRAILEFERVLELDSHCIEAYFHLGKTYDHLERYDDAIHMFEELLKVQPDNGQAYWHLGVLYDKKKMGSQALEMYQKANLLSTAKKGSNRR